MVDFKAFVLAAAILAAAPAFAIAQDAKEAEQAALRLKEADRLARQGMTSVSAGNYASAAIPLEASLMIREQVLGPDHADTVGSLNNLGLVYLSLGRPEEAADLLGRSLASSEKTLGADHPGVADILHNLASAYAASDDPRRVEQALPLLDRAAAIRHAPGPLGPEHPRVADTLGAMAAIDLALARRAGTWHMPDLLAGIRPTPAASARPKLSRDAYLDRAERALERALAIRQKALGPDHPAVASSLRNLAGIRAGRGRYAEAEPFMRRALAITEKASGPAHPATASALDQYADILANARNDAATAAGE